MGVVACDAVHADVRAVTRRSHRSYDFAVREGTPRARLLDQPESQGPPFEISVDGRRSNFRWRRAAVYLFPDPGCRPANGVKVDAAQTFGSPSVARNLRLESTRRANFKMARTVKTTASCGVATASSQAWQTDRMSWRKRRSPSVPRIREARSRPAERVRGYGPNDARRADARIDRGSKRSRRDVVPTA